MPESGWALGFWFSLGDHVLRGTFGQEGEVKAISECLCTYPHKKERVEGNGEEEVGGWLERNRSSECGGMATEGQRVHTNVCVLC